MMLNSLIQSRGLWALLSALALVFFAAELQAASEPEVMVTGCVVDVRGQPYRNVRVELNGLNYRGGAGYTDNNSVDTTDVRGEFSVRMKAGTPGQPGVGGLPAVPEQPARAIIRGKFETYVAKGWGGGTFAGADVWPETRVSNIGKPVDLRPQGCIRFPYPLDVSGVVTSDKLDISPHPSLTLRIRAVGDYLHTTTYIPEAGGSQTFNFGVDLRLDDAYEIVIHEKPRGAECAMTHGSRGVVGAELVLLPGSYNYWAATGLRVHCRKKTETEQVDASDPKAARDELPRRSGSSGSEMFQQEINQAEQEEKDRPAREARERAAKAAAVTAEARQTPEDRLRKNYDQRITAAREQCTASKESCNSGCTGAAVAGLLSMFLSKGTGASEASSQIQQCSNSCDGAKSSCDQQVSSLEQEKSQAIADARNPQRSTASSSRVAQAPSGGGARGLPVKECHRQANASNLGDKLNALSRNDSVLLARGSIFNLDFLIRTYSQCLPDQETQQAINGWKAQREATLKTCRQISNSDNCLVSPYEVRAYEQAEVRKDAQDARETGAAVGQLLDAFGRYQKAKQDSRTESSTGGQRACVTAGRVAVNGKCEGAAPSPPARGFGGRAVN